MRPKAAYFIQPFERQHGLLRSTDPVLCRDEDHAGRRGAAMRPRVAGMVFYRIETSADGDEWFEVEVLATAGEVPAAAD